MGWFSFSAGTDFGAERPLHPAPRNGGGTARKHPDVAGGIAAVGASRRVAARTGPAAAHGGAQARQGQVARRGMPAVGRSGGTAYTTTICKVPRARGAHPSRRRIGTSV